jgi:hypothetical protein
MQRRAFCAGCTDMNIFGAEGITALGFFVNDPFAASNISLQWGVQLQMRSGVVAVVSCCFSKARICRS